MNIVRTELQDSARKLFDPASYVPDRQKSWDGIVEMGWPALAIPEELGGLGEGKAALTTLYREIGRVLAPVPFLPVMLAAQAICQSHTLANRESWVERLIAGEVITCSLLDPIVDCHSNGKLSGTLDAVPDADKASHVLVVTPDKRLCALVALDRPSVTMTGRRMWDESRPLFDVVLNHTEVQPDLVLARDDDAARLAAELQEHLLLATAADSVGAAAATLDMTVEYLKTRRQFDRPLALFQALKHRCADLKALLDSADALVEKYVAGDTGLPFDAVTGAGAVKSYAAWVFRAIAEEAIQLHGGIGLTSEHPCHLFLKRSFLNASLGGTIDEWETVAGQQALAANS